MDNNQLRTKLLMIYGVATSFNELSVEDLANPEFAKAALDTGRQIQAMVWDLLGMIPKGN